MSELSPELGALIEKARHYKMTPEERFEQRVSLVYSGCSDSVSKDDVRQILTDPDGWLRLAQARREAVEP